MAVFRPALLGDECEIAGLAASPRGTRTMILQKRPLCMAALLSCLALLPTVTSFSAASLSSLGKILGPGKKGSWDDFKVSGPVVRPKPKGDGWNLWYYGRSEAFNKTADLINLPSGFIGLAESKDGITFSKVNGVGGPVLGPGDDAKAFDSLHVGIGDILWSGDRWTMYYFGGDGEYGPTPYGMARGIYMRIGRAESKDGVSWTRKPGIVLDRGAEEDFDSLFVGWPQVVDVGGVMGGEGTQAMFYHSFNTRTFGFEVGVALSADSGNRWVRKGPVKMTRGERGSYRDLGHATRCVVRDPAGRRKLLMFAECANMAGCSSIGVYGSDDGLQWDDMHDGPVFTGSGLGTGRWDAQALGCPSVIVRDGRFYMYYVGFAETSSEGAALGCIGLAASDGYDFTKWTRLGGQ